MKQLPKYDYSDKIQINRQTGLQSKVKKILYPLTSTIIYLRYYFSIKKQIAASLANKQYDMVLIGGGQLVNSTPKQKISFFAIAFYAWAKAFTKMQIPFGLIGIGAAGSYHTAEKRLYQQSLVKAKFVWVRDLFSQQSLLTHFKLQSILAPDVAFFETASASEKKIPSTALVGIYNFDEYNKSFPNNYFDKIVYYEQWKKIIIRYIQEGKKVSLFYTTITDADETILFQKHLALQQIQVQIAMVDSLQQLEVILEQTESVYSARMHALILAYKKECTVEAFEISQKLKSFSEEYIQSTKQPAAISKLVYDTFVKLVK